MNKRGQIFIFAAIIIGLVTFLLFTRPNTMHEEILLENFGQVSQNYLSEMPKVVDNSIYNEELVEKNLEKYTNDFLVKYARRELDPNVGIVYIYSNGTDLIIDNHLKGEIVSFKQDMGQIPMDVAFSTDTKMEGDLVLEETGISGDLSAKLCIEELKDYCILAVDPGSLLILKIGDYIYEFEIATKSPNIIAIIKSSDGITTKVDTFQTTI